MKSLKEKTKTRSVRMAKSIEPQPSTLGEKMANKLPTSKNEVKKAKFRFNYIVSDDESDDGNLGAAHTQSSKCYEYSYC